MSPRTPRFLSCHFLVFLCLIMAAPGLPATDPSTTPAGSSAGSVGVATDTGEAAVLPPLTIAGETAPDPLQVPLMTPPNHALFTTSVTREDLERQHPANAGEAIRNVSPGLVWTRQNRKYRNFYETRGGRVSLAIDGMIIQDGSTSGNGMRGDDRILDLLDPNTVEGIDVIEDSSALVYGSAKGGMIRVRTRKPSENRRTASYEFGSFGRSDLRFTLSERQNPKQAFYLALQGSNFDGPENKNAMERRSSFFLKYFWDPNPKDAIEFTCQRALYYFHIPIDELKSDRLNTAKKAWFAATTSLVTTAANGWNYGPWGNTQFGLDWNHSWNSRHATDLRFDKVKVTNDFFNPRGVAPSPIGHTSPHHVLETTTSTALRHTWKWSGFGVTRFGASLNHWNNPSGKLYWENKANEDRQYAMWLQNDIPLMGDKLMLDLGARREKRYVVREQKARLPAGSTALGVVSNQWEDPRDSLAAGLTWKATGRDTLALRLASLEVTPIDRQATFDARPLADEKDRLVNFGWAHAFGQTQRTRLKLNLFEHRLDNAIIDDTSRTRFIDPPANTTAMRIFKNQDTRARGYEANLEQRWTHLTAQVGVGRIDFEPDVALSPNTTANASLRWKGPHGWGADLWGRYVSQSRSSVSLVTGKNAAGRTVNTTFPYFINDYVDLNLAISRTFGHGARETRWTLMARNLLDDDYETRPLTPEYGRQISLICDTAW